MHLALSGDGLFALVILLIAAGVVTGFLSGLLGIGGGGVLVPVLYEAFGLMGVSEDIRMHVTLGTTLAVIAPTAITSFLQHKRRGTVDVDVIKRLAPWVFCGVVLGTFIAKSASSEALRWIWVLFGSLLALKMAIGRDDWRIANELPRPPWLEVPAFVIGVLSTLMGIGGATFTVPLLSLHGRSLLQSVSTATAMGPVIALPGLVGYILTGWGEPGLPPFSLGYVNLGAVLLAPLAVAVVPFGVRVAHGVSKRQLELAFAAFMIVVVGRFLVTLL